MASLYELLEGAGVADILIPRDEFIKEHKHLIGLLRKPKAPELKKEADTQEAELKKMTGGRMGQASGFIRRMMAENRLKHKGQYRNPTAPLVPGTKMNKPVAFKFKKLANASQNGTNTSAYGASPFIIKHFGTDEPVRFKRKRGKTFEEGNTVPFETERQSWNRRFPASKGYAPFGRRRPPAQGAPAVPAEAPRLEVVEEAPPPEPKPAPKAEPAPKPAPKNEVKVVEPEEEEEVGSEKGYKKVEDALEQFNKDAYTKHPPLDIADAKPLAKSLKDYVEKEYPMFGAKRYNPSFNPMLDYVKGLDSATDDYKRCAFWVFYNLAKNVRDYKDAQSYEARKRLIVPAFWEGLTDYFCAQNADRARVDAFFKNETRGFDASSMGMISSLLTRIMFNTKAPIANLAITNIANVSQQVQYQPTIQRLLLRYNVDNKRFDPVGALNDILPELIEMYSEEEEFSPRAIVGKTLRALKNNPPIEKKVLEFVA